MLPKLVLEVLICSTPIYYHLISSKLEPPISVFAVPKNTLQNQIIIFAGKALINPHRRWSPIYTFELSIDLSELIAVSRQYANHKKSAVLASFRFEYLYPLGYLRIHRVWHELCKKYYPSA